jgi:hypothetical protein
MRTPLVTALVAAFVTVTAGGAPAQIQSRCDRACLDNLADAYVEALVARAPSRLPLARAATFTENGQRLELGDGLWHTVTGKGTYALHLADVEKGQSVLMGTIREADVPTILVLRLRVVARRIAEIETLVIRNKDAAAGIEATGAPRRALLDAVPAADRLSRDELVRIANMYFSGIERNDGKGVYPLHDTCARLENGTFTAGGPSKSTCLQQFQAGVFFYVTRIRDRRFVVVDAERGLAFAFAFFDNASGDARKGTLADGRTVLSGPVVPWTWQIAEVFKIERGKIGEVESVLHPVPYGMGSGWSTWDDAMSSRPRW